MSVATGDAAPGFPAGYRLATPEVVYGNEATLSAGDAEVAALKALAARSPRRRARLCAHPAPDSDQQEMLIVMDRDSYVRPHRHRDRTETLTVLDGEADALLFDEAGRLDAILPMRPLGAGGRFFYRMEAGRFHTLVFRTPWLVVLETTRGPFDPAGSEGAPWAPAETDPSAGLAYLRALTAGGLR